MSPLFKASSVHDATRRATTTVVAATVDVNQINVVKRLIDWFAPPVACNLVLCTEVI